MLVSDYVHPTPRGGRCRIRIYEEAGELPVVLCTELPDNEGTSITNSAERIAAEVLANHPGVFDPFGRVSLGGLSYDKPFVWIEHYLDLDGARGSEATQDPATFDLVEFSHYEPRGVLRAGEWLKEIGEPSRSALDRASVEALIGEPLER
jgi:hypothetical protein